MCDLQQRDRRPLEVSLPCSYCSLLRRVDEKNADPFPVEAPHHTSAETLSWMQNGAGVKLLAWSWTARMDDRKVRVPAATIPVGIRLASFGQ